MSTMTVSSGIQRAAKKEASLVFGAFFAIYVLWGTTFLAIRIAVAELPPLFAAGVRFLAAGSILYLFMRAKGEPGPDRREWRNLSILSLLLFIAVYGPLFWAEKAVPSGLAALIQATIPIITLALEMMVLRVEPFRWRAAAAATLGFVGVAILLLPDKTQRVTLLPCFAILAGGT